MSELADCHVVSLADCSASFCIVGRSDFADMLTPKSLKFNHVHLWRIGPALRPVFRSVRLDVTCKADAGFRPTLDDVDRISR